MRGQPSCGQYVCAVALALDNAGVVRHQDKSAVPALFKKLTLAFVVETAIAYRDDLVDQEAVELDRHRQCKRQTRSHSGRIVQDRLAQVDAQLSEILDERHHTLEVDAVDAADEAQVVQPSQVL